MLNVCLICSALLIVQVIFVITVFFLFLLCVSTILVNKDDNCLHEYMGNFVPIEAVQSDLHRPSYRVSNQL